MTFCKRALGVVICLSVASLYAQTGAPKKLQLSGAEQEVLKLTNIERKKENLPALQTDDALTQVARAHSANMAKQEKMQHELDGKNPFERIKGVGYKYFFAGENIAAGDVPVDLIMEAWMKSPGHRKNILNKDYTHIGIGVVRNEKGDFYYTQIFAKPRP